MKWIKEFNSYIRESVSESLYELVNKTYFALKVGVSDDVHDNMDDIDTNDIDAIYDVTYHKTKMINQNDFNRIEKFIKSVKLSNNEFHISLYKNSIAIRSDELDIYIDIYSSNDRYFMVRIDGIDVDLEYYECDDIDGVIRLLEDQVFNEFNNDLFSDKVRGY